MSKDYFVKSQGMAGTGFKTGMAVVLIVLGSLGLFLQAGGVAVSLGIGILMLFTTRWEKNNPIVRLHGDHLELKPGMIAPKRLVLYRDVEGVKRVSDARAFVTTADAKRVHLPLAALEPSAGRELLQALVQRVNEVREKKVALT